MGQGQAQASDALHGLVRTLGHRGVIFAETQNVWKMKAQGTPLSEERYHFRHLNQPRTQRKSRDQGHSKFLLIKGVVDQDVGWSNRGASGGVQF